MAEKVFVSPGVYTSEKDLSFVTRQVGVTTLGLVGETTKGPAFQPIFITNYGEFQSFFGGLNNTLVNGPIDGNGAPLYELPYIAKSYLSQSNQLFVTRVLGFSGYDAGRSWGITLDANLDPSTVTSTITPVSPIVAYTASTGGVLLNTSINNATLSSKVGSGEIDLTFLGTFTLGLTNQQSTVYTKAGSVFTSYDFSFTSTSRNQTPYVLDPATSGASSTVNDDGLLFSVLVNTASSQVQLYETTNELLFIYFNGGIYANPQSIPVSFDSSPIPSSVRSFTSEFFNQSSSNYSAFTINYNTVDVVDLAPSPYNQVDTVRYEISGNILTYSAISIPVFITGSSNGSVTTNTGYGYADVEDKVVAFLRSRGSVNTTTQSTNFQLTANTSVTIDPAVTTAELDPLGNFSLIGTSTTQGAFNYSCSFDKTQKNYLPRVLGRTAQDGKTALFVEELYDNMFRNDIANDKVRGINLSLVNYGNAFSDYKQEYKPASTPYIVSELRGNDVLKLFKIWTISDGNSANEEIKISIANIKPDTREFDVYVRSFSDSDAQPSVIEAFTRCTMNPTSNNFIGRRIGTLDGVYASKSSYILIELNEDADTSDAFPAGFMGYPLRTYAAGTPTAIVPNIVYKTTYGQYENKRKFYLGLTDSLNVTNTTGGVTKIGIDSDFFDYKGAVTVGNVLSHGFHMDMDASAATINNVAYTFDVGNSEFRTDAGLIGGSYEKVFSRKFTLVPYGGFDGWDVYRTRRTNRDNYIINGTYGQAGLNSGAFTTKTLTNGDNGITSDYYAYLEAIWTFRNPEAVNINVFATPGIDTFDNTNLIEAAIEMVEQDRADSLYIVTTPDTSSGDIMTVSDVVDYLDGMYDSSYTATYWPWIQILDAENNVYIYVPPTRDVVRNIALTDNISFPWFAVAGIQRGDVDAIKARKKLTLSERDVLYENRVNPIATFTSDGIKIWGNKTLQIKESALDRINVRRLLLQARKLISAVAIRLLFEQNDAVVRNQFLSLVNPILDSIRTERGLTDFRVVLSSDPEEIDRNQLTGKIYLKPTRALEYIIVEFNIMNTGASFDNI